MLKDLSLESMSKQKQKCAPIQCTVWPSNVQIEEKILETFSLIRPEKTTKISKLFRKSAPPPLEKILDPPMPEFKPCHHFFFMLSIPKTCILLDYRQFLKLRKHSFLFFISTCQTICKKFNGFLKRTPKKELQKRLFETNSKKERLTLLFHE